MPTQYATTTDLARLGLASGVLSRVDTAELDAQLAAASQIADGYLRAHPYVLPLTAWGDDLRAAVCALASENLIVTRGANPEDPANKAVFDRANHWRAWLRDVSRGAVDLSVTDSTPTVDEPATFASSRARRGWRRY